ncbi:MAG: FlgD immunoglobulin-like domain containing protein, partial [Candidatus Eisenbacteria bacterium]
PQITLKGVVPVSGIVLGPNGLPLAGAKVKFYDVTVQPSVRQGAANDRTDANGHFEVLVPDNIYDVNFEPPVGVNALVYHWNNLDTGAGGVDIGSIPLSTGLPLSGHVQGPGATPLLNVNINILDQVTRTAQRVSHDNTDANGDFTVYVNPGTYAIHYDPPACDGMAPLEVSNVDVFAPTTLPVTNLVTGVHLLGAVTDAASLPVLNADLDVYPAGGATKLYTPGDKTSATGNYDVLVAPGTYDVRYIPSSLTRLRPALRTSVALPANTTVPTVVLANGWLVSGTVRQVSSLLPLAGAEVQFYQPHTAFQAWTPHATTGTLGTFNTSVDAGTYDIKIVAPPLSGLIDRFLTNVTVSADLPLGDQVLIFPSTGVAPGAGAGLSLAAPFPNPSHRRVDLSFTVPDGEAELSAWDVAGRRVATLWHGRASGAVQVQWDGTRDGGSMLPAGLYLVRLTDAHGGRQLRRVTLLQ